MRVPYSRMIKVTNRDSGSISYIVPDMNGLRRRFGIGETKDITFEELRKLANTEGGRRLVEDCLLIHDKEAVEEILGNVEPEYNYTEKDIEDLLLKGSYDQLLDCLDYAPLGVIEILKNKAVTLKINDLRKREAIQKKTGLDINSAIKINETTAETEDTENIKRERRAAPINVVQEEKTTSRRSTPITTKKYEIIE